MVTVALGVAQDRDFDKFELGVGVSPSQGIVGGGRQVSAPEEVPAVPGTYKPLHLGRSPCAVF